MNLEIKHLWSHKCPKKWDQYTLIALVITIIILIILAGISISMLMGENGLISKAKQGAQNYQNAAIEEQERLNTLYSDFESQSTVIGTYDAIANLINFKRTIATAITNAGVNTSENDDAETMADNIAEIYQGRYEEGVADGESQSTGIDYPNVLYYYFEGDGTQSQSISDNCNIGDLYVIYVYKNYNVQFSGVDVLDSFPTNNSAYDVYICKATETTITLTGYYRVGVTRICKKDNSKLNYEIIAVQTNVNKTIPCNENDLILYSMASTSTPSVTTTGLRKVVFENQYLQSYIWRATSTSVIFKTANSTTNVIRIY